MLHNDGLKQSNGIEEFLVGSDMFRPSSKAIKVRFEVLPSTVGRQGHSTTMFHSSSPYQIQTNLPHVIESSR